jgi:hypothetical protein
MAVAAVTHCSTVSRRAPSCAGHELTRGPAGKRLAPEYAKAATTLKNDGIRIAKVYARGAARGG